MKAYVIKRDNGKYLYQDKYNEDEFFNEIFMASMFDDKETAERYIEDYHPKLNLQAVPISIIETNNENTKEVEALDKVKMFMENYIDQNDDFDKLWKYIENLIKEYGDK